MLLNCAFFISKIWYTHVVYLSNQIEAKCFSLKNYYITRKMCFINEKIFLNIAKVTFSNFQIMEIVFRSKYLNYLLVENFNQQMLIFISLVITFTAVATEFLTVVTVKDTRCKHLEITRRQSMQFIVGYFS